MQWPTGEGGKRVVDEGEEPTDEVGHEEKDVLRVCLSSGQINGHLGVDDIDGAALAHLA